MDIRWYPVHLLYTQCLIAGEIKTIGGGIRVPWTLFLVWLRNEKNNFQLGTLIWEPVGTKCA